jgi:CheY-like chemotaxis protein/MinD-like ATPase involved in chromosome partitioning or flagellar assembly
MGKKLLLVDDDRDMLKLLGLAFHRKGFEVVGAENGEAGLRKAREENPDVIILDVMLPDLSGLEVCQRLHQDVATASLPVLLLSARGQTVDKLAGFQAGAEDYVTKPFEMPELVARVELILARAAQKKAPSGRVITFVGAKGGVGTSTVAVNVAMAIMNRGKSVVIADFHPSLGTICYQLGLTPRRTLSDLFALPADRINERALNLSLETHHSGLRVLAAPLQPLLAEPAIGVAEDLFESLRLAAEFVIIDAPAYSNLSQVALMRSDVIAVVAEPQTVSIACAQTTLSFLKSLGVKGEWVALVLVNRSRSPLSIAPSDVQRALNTGILGVIPSAEDACLSAERQKMPLVLAQPEHLASASLYELTDRLMANRVTALSY